MPAPFSPFSHVVIEPLETRIAPASLTFLDVDQVEVTVTANKGTNEQLAQVVKLTAEGDGFELREIRLSELADVYQNVNLSIVKGTKTDVLFVNVGYINAVGVDLGRVLVDGDLGQIDAGVTTPSTINSIPVQVGKGIAVKSLTVGSFGTLGLATQDPVTGSLSSTLLGRLGSLTVLGDFKEATLDVVGVSPDPDPLVSDDLDSRGDIGDVTIGGSLIGGAANRSGGIFAKGNVGDVQIGGDLRGGAGDESGSIFSERRMGKVQIAGAVIGGNAAGAATAEKAGSIVSGGGMGSVSVGNGIQGGDGKTSGAIGSGGSIGKIRITGNIQGGSGELSGTILAPSGASSVIIEGSIIGGSGFSSGAIGSSASPLGVVKVTGDLIGGSNFISGVITSAASIKSVEIGGKVQGGSGEASGAIGATGKIGKVSIGTDLLGGGGVRSGAILTQADIDRVEIGGNAVGGSGNESGGIAGRDLGVIVIGGNLDGGSFDASAPGDLAGSINAKGRIGKVEIGGQLIGDDGNKSGSISSLLSIGTVTIGGGIVGSSGSFSGAILSGGKLGKVVIEAGGITGGEGSFSGLIETQGDLEAGDIGTISITGDLAGGAGSNSGQIFSSGGIKKIIVGTIAGGNEANSAGSGSITSTLDLDEIVVNGDLAGSSISNTGFIRTFGKLGELTIHGSVTSQGAGYTEPDLATGGDLIILYGQIYADEAIGSVQVTGSVVGGNGAGSGLINGAAIKKVSIGGNLVGAGGATGSIFAREGNLGSVQIGGDFQAAGSNGFSFISAQGDIGKLAIGSLIGNEASRGKITALGDIGTITITDSVTNFDLLAGFAASFGATPGGSLVFANFAPSESSVSIGKVTIGTTGAGNWQGTNLVAGSVPGEDGKYGTEDDAAISSNVRTGASKIASIVIKGAVSSALGNSDGHFGIVAAKVVAAKVSGSSIALTSGLDFVDILGTGGTTTDLSIKEVPSGPI
jgi:hypothetical protein